MNSNTPVNLALLLGDPITLFICAEHLELIYGEYAATSNQIFSYGASFVPALLDGSIQTSFDLPFRALLKVIVVLSFISIALIFFFILSSLSNKSEWSNDVENFISSASTEAEKELFALDDAMYLVGVICLLMAAYFGASSLGALFQQYDASLFIFSLPMLFLTLFCVPVNLLYDFGLFFLLYLRGVATTKVLFFELLYDYIGVIAFFTRLLVQFVRLVLMFVVFFLMHEAVMFYNLGQSAAPFSGSTYETTFVTS